MARTREAITADLRRTAGSRNYRQADLTRALIDGRTDDTVTCMVRIDALTRRLDDLTDELADLLRAEGTLP